MFFLFLSLFPMYSSCSDSCDYNGCNRGSSWWCGTSTMCNGTIKSTGWNKMDGCWETNTKCYFKNSCFTWRYVNFPLKQFLCIQHVQHPVCSMSLAKNNKNSSSNTKCVGIKCNFVRVSEWANLVWIYVREIVRREWHIKSGMSAYKNMYDYNK